LTRVASGRRLQERAVRQLQRTVKQNVVPDHVLVVKTDTRADGRLAVLPRIPSDSQRRSEIQIWVGNRSAEVRPGRYQVVEVRLCGQIAVGTASVANIAQAQIYCEIRQHFPGVGDIEAETVVGTKPTGREAKSRLRG